MHKQKKGNLLEKNTMFVVIRPKAYLAKVTKEAYQTLLDEWGSTIYNLKAMGCYNHLFHCQQ